MALRTSATRLDNATSIPLMSSGPSLRRLRRLDMAGFPGRSYGAMTVFRGAVYVIPAADPAERVPACILRANLSSGAWETVLSAPEESPPRARGHAQAPFRGRMVLGRDAVLTGMTVFQGAGDALPCLYVTVASPDGAKLLRSEDGTTFTRVYKARQGGSTTLAFPTVWGGLLVMVASGDVSRKGESLAVRVVGTPAPGLKNPIALSRRGFDDPDNMGIGPFAVLGTRLFAATTNPMRGFQIWSAEAPASDVEKIAWVQILRDGAFRHARNPEVTAMASHFSALYIAAGDSAWGRPGPELLRLEQDGQWEVVAGEARFTPDGLKVPLSLLGPGFGDGTVRCISVIGGSTALVAGTGPPGRAWASTDGEEWLRIEDDGLSRIDAICPFDDDLLIAARDALYLL